MSFSTAGLLPVIEKKAPKIAPVIKRLFVEYFVPSNRNMGIRIHHISQDLRDFELRLVSRRGNKNLSKSTNAGVLLAFAECVHGVAVLWHFSPANHRMITVRSKMDYIALGFGTLFTRFSLTTEMKNSIDEQLTQSQVCELELSSTVFDSNEKKIAVLVNTYQIKRR